MIDPLTDDNISLETDKFIAFSNYENKKRYKYPQYMYVFVIMMYIIEITTIIIAEIYDNTDGLNELTLNRWLMFAAIYNVLGLMAIFQFTSCKYNNKHYLIIYECIKMIWLIIGLIILFNWNGLINTIFIYTLIYIILESIWMINNFVKLQKIIHNYYLL